MDRGRESQGSTTAYSNMSERDGKDQWEGSSKQACSYWFSRSSWLATVGRTSILLGAWPMLYCVSLALSISRLDFVIWFCYFFFFVAPYLLICCRWISLFPSIYDIDGCATTAAYLVSGWVFTVTTGWIFEISLCENSIIQFKKNVPSVISPVQRTTSGVGDRPNQHNVRKQTNKQTLSQ